MANRAVSLYQSVKLNGKWTFRKAGRTRHRLIEGQYFVSWYEQRRKFMRGVGKDADVAIAAANRKRAELNFVAAGGLLSPTTAPAVEPADLKSAMSEYLGDCRSRQGRSGYGLAKTTVDAYTNRLGFLTEFDAAARMNTVDVPFMKRFLKFLQTHPAQLSDRSCYNVIQAASTFLRTHGIVAGSALLRQLAFPPKPVVPYSNAEMIQFFNTCTDDERLIFKFFLHSLAREQEVAHCEVRDLFFDRNVLHISPKPDRGFRLKGKRSGQAKNGRKIPLPAAFMQSLRSACHGRSGRALVFPNGQGGVENHFLRRCKTIAKRAGLATWREFELHRWRKTGATRHHEGGVSVRKIQCWLGHESLDLTLAYLGVDDAADETSQEQVNNGALAAFA